MAIATDQTGTGAVTTASTTFVVDITAAATGSFVYLWVQWGLQAATFSQTGWTELVNGGPASTITGALFFRQKVGGDTTFTFTTGSAKGSHQWQSYTGLDSATPHQTVTGSNLLAKSSASVNVSTPSVTNTDAIAWAFAGFASRTSTVGNKVITFTPDAALTERQDSNNSAASSSIWTGGEIADSNAPVTAAAHSYTAVASFSETFGVGVLIYLMPAGGAAATAATMPGMPGRTWLRRFQHRRTPPQLGDVAAAVTPVSLADTGTGTDALSADAAVPLADTGTGTDGLAVAATVGLADTGTGTDALLVSVPIPMADTGIGTDALTVSIAVPLADPRTVADALAVGVAATLADTGTGSDALTVSAAVPLADTGTVTDALMVSAAGNPSLPDTATGTDALTVTAVIAFTDTATGTDALSVVVPRTLTDTGTGADVLAVTVATPLADPRTVTDALSVAAIVALAQAVTATENLTVQAVGANDGTPVENPVLALTSPTSGLSLNGAASGLVLAGAGTSLPLTSPTSRLELD